MTARTKGRKAAVSVALGICAGIGAASAQEAPFGGQDSTAFAEALWAALGEARLVGDEVVRSYAYAGNEPHGVILEQTETTLSVQGETGTVIVKHNYMAQDEPLSAEQVASSQWMEYLDAVTVMFRRESGYNAEAGDWFWAKYLPDGSLDRTPQGMPMAGRVPGCIQCHQNAEGGDYVFLHDRYATN